MKKSLADKIEEYLKVLIERSENRQIEIQRAELAETFCCVPSQVTYVISTRFNEKSGYLTESRRGGKGYVKITRLDNDDPLAQMSRNNLFDFLDRIKDEQIISRRENEMLKHLAVYAFKEWPSEERSRIFKAIEEALKDYLM
ncbi:CtsR family transcriptional regulator [Thermosyntropha sp.]|uniref:CtsR family transcriptional regulator n=1 Tax=Thermosyntropha sp. TaxID=2740820 RepID=UPI0025F29692|nr:CtsR family transcriptional regulator [Thermosyntropha sp.]MBO8158004.1 CtsR family transcriptional regulator [Thermosyntropha sp.]